MKLKELLVKKRENLQLAYGVIFMILIPSLITLNTVYIIGKYNSDIDTVLQRKSLAMGRIIYTSIQDDINNTNKIQQKIERISEKSSEFEDIQVLVPDEESFKIVASSQQEEVGQKVGFYYYQIVWTQPDNDGLATDSLKLANTADGKSLAASSDGKRFWMVAIPIEDVDGNRKAILSLKISSEVVDSLTEYSKNASLFVLIITIIITVFFLSVTVQLWDYALLYKKIKEIDRMKDEFISIASHELRSPLTSIKGYTSLIMEGTFGKIRNDDMKQSLERIMISTERLESLVEDLLDVSRIEQGRMAIKMENMDLAPIIEEIISQFAVNAKEKKLEIVYNKPGEELPPVYADPDRLKQVLVNLISNSVKYTETGSIVVVSEVMEDGRMHVRISDTGIGISPEAQKSLFQKFYRVKTEKTEGIPGTGLGLWITKRIVEMMDGKIYVESIEGRGTQMTIVLKLAAKNK